MALSYLGMLNTPRLTVADMQRQLVDRQKEAASGRKADIGLSLGSEMRRATEFHYDIEITTNLVDMDESSANSLSVVQDAMSSMVDIAQKFSATVIGARNAVNGREVIRQAAQTSLSTLTSLLNTTYAGQYVFGGIESGKAPIADYFASPSSAAKASIDTAFLADFGFSQSSPSAAAITDAQMEAFISGALSATFQDPSWGVNWSDASSINRTIRVDHNRLTSVAVNANQEAFRELAKALAMAANLTEAPLSAATLAKVADHASSAASQAASGIALIQSNVGLVQADLTESRSRLNRRNNSLEKAVLGLEGVDAYQTATEITTLTTQLEASYALTSRLSRLSLLDYIR